MQSVQFLRRGSPAWERVRNNLHERAARVTAKETDATKQVPCSRFDVPMGIVSIGHAVQVDVVSEKLGKRRITDASNLILKPVTHQGWGLERRIVVRRLRFNTLAMYSELGLFVHPYGRLTTLPGGEKLTDEPKRTCVRWRGKHTQVRDSLIH